MKVNGKDNIPDIKLWKTKAIFQTTNQNKINKTNKALGILWDLFRTFEAAQKIQTQVHDPHPRH